MSTAEVKKIRKTARAEGFRPRLRIVNGKWEIAANHKGGVLYLDHPVEVFDVQAAIGAYWRYLVATGKPIKDRNGKTILPTLTPVSK